LKISITKKGWWNGSGVGSECKSQDHKKKKKDKRLRLGDLHGNVGVLLLLLYFVLFCF
jgi:hypothetical protein